MKFEDIQEFPHEDKLRALHGDKNWRVYFPNGYGVDIVGGPQNLEPFTLPNGKSVRIDFLYGDGINTFEVAKFEHNINTNKPVQGLLEPISPGLFFDIEEYVSKDRVNEILSETESL